MLDRVVGACVISLMAPRRRGRTELIGRRFGVWQLRALRRVHPTVTVILTALACACLPLAVIAVVGGRTGRLGAALAFIAVLFAMTALAGFVVFTANLGTWPYTAVICAAEVATGALVARRLARAVRIRGPRG